MNFELYSVYPTLFITGESWLSSCYMLHSYIFSENDVDDKWTLIQQLQAAQLAHIMFLSTLNSTNYKLG